VLLIGTGAACHLRPSVAGHIVASRTSSQTPAPGRRPSPSAMVAPEVPRIDAVMLAKRAGPGWCTCLIEGAAHR